MLLYTNPPFGTASTNRLVSKKGEMNGVEHLFDLCKDCIVYDNQTIGDVLGQIKESKTDFGKCTKGIKDEVAKRQAQIGYWDYVPIP